MSGRGEPTEETSQKNTPDKRQTTKIIYIVYIVAALDITWMFLQFSVTPVSICDVSEHEAKISVPTLNAKTLPEALLVNLSSLHCKCVKALMSSSKMTVDGCSCYSGCKTDHMYNKSSYDLRRVNFHPTSSVTCGVRRKILNCEYT